MGKTCIDIITLFSRKVREKVIELNKIIVISRICSNAERGCRLSTKKLK